MKNIFLLFLLFLIFTLVSSKSIIPSVKMGVNTTFDLNDNEFEFEYSGPGTDLILFYFKIDNNSLIYKIDCPNSHSQTQIYNTQETELASNFRQLNKKGTCKIKFESEERNKGSFVIYTAKNKLSIKLKNKYGNLIHQYDSKAFMSLSQITFSVPNLDRDITAKFEYNKTSVDIYGSTFNIENPFKVCKGKKCIDNVNTYDFEKGESYEINIKVSQVKTKEGWDYIIVPGFTFYDQNYNGTYSPDDILDEANVLKIKFFILSLILFII